MPTRFLTSPDDKVNFLQDLIADFFDCHKKYDALAEGKRVSDKLFFMATNRALPTAMAASLHALLKASLHEKGELPSRDLLLCFTCIMAALTGGGALDRFLRTRQADVPAQQLLFNSVSAEFEQVFKKRENMLHGSFEKLLKNTKVKSLVNSSLGSSVQVKKLQRAALDSAVSKMRKAGYFSNTAWTQVMSGGMMQAEQMSWEMLAGAGSNGVCPLIQFEDPAVVSRYISYLDVRWVHSVSPHELSSMVI